MKYWLKAIIGLVVAFLIRAVLAMGFHQVIGQRMLDAAGWTAGTRPPTPYMTASVVVALLAAAAAGIGAALIVGRARIRHALACGVLFSGAALWANRVTLFGSPHPYEWPLILAPVIAMPLGAWLIVCLTPLPRNEAPPSVAA